MRFCIAKLTCNGCTFDLPVCITRCFLVYIEHVTSAKSTKICYHTYPAQFTLCQEACRAINSLSVLEGALYNIIIFTNVLSKLSKKMATQLCQLLIEVTSTTYSRLSLILMMQNARAYLARCVSPTTSCDF